MDRQPVWPGWETVRMISRGGFGTVYEICRSNFGNVERAALKVITIPQNQNDIDDLLDVGHDSESITLYFRSCLEGIVNEYSLMQQLKGNTNIVYCDDLRYIQHDDGIGWDIYIKMELLTPLMRALPAQITEEQVLRLGMDICNALVLCKSRGIIHRDIKPQNIFISQDGNYKLGDFGIAKIEEQTASGTRIGTYKYMAPEVYHGRPYGAAADIYSLGLVLYWLLNEKRTPFLPLPPQIPTMTMEEQARNRRLSGEHLPPPAHGSEELKRIVLKACAPEPRDRYHTAAEMREDLEALLQNAENGHRRPGTPESWDEVTVVGGAGPEADVTQLDRTVKTQHGGKKQERAILEDNNRNGNHKKWVLALVAALLTIAAVIFCVQVLPAGNEVPGAEQTEPPAAESVTAAPTEAPEDIRFRQVQEHCAALVASGDISGAADYAQAQADDSGDTRYAALAAEYRTMWKEGILDEAEALALDGKYRVAIQKLDEAWKNSGEWEFYDRAGDYRMEFGISNSSYVAAGKYNSIIVMDNGRVVVAGDEEYGELDAKYWSDITAVSAGDRHTVGLRANGTVVAVGDNEQGQCATGSWSNVVAIAAGDVHTIALREDGTLLAAGQQWAPRCDMDSLYSRAGGKRIVSIAAGYVHSLALLEDGTVVAVGENGQKQCDVEYWTDIAAVYAGTYYSLGLKTDGSVVIAGLTGWNVAGWTNLSNLAAGDYFVVGLTDQNTLVSVGMEKDIGPHTPNTISYWTDIVQVAAGHDHIITISKDGISHCAGKDDLNQVYLDGFSVTYPRRMAAARG